MTAVEHWQRMTTRAEARALQSFRCTTNHPESPGGRRLPHPRPWEWEAQRHLRQLSQLLLPGDVALLGRVDEEVIAALHLTFDADADLLVAFHAAAGVAQTVRGLGGHVADELLTEAEQVAAELATARGCRHVMTSGKVHLRNTASQRMLARAGWAPLGAPTGTYQSWAQVTTLPR